MRPFLRSLVILSLIILLLPLSLIKGGPDDPFVSTTLYLNDGPILDRMPSSDNPFTINKFGDWENVDSGGLFGVYNNALNASLDLVVINDAKLEVTLEFELHLDQDGDGSFEVILGFNDIFIPSSTGTGIKNVQMAPNSMSGNWSEMVNGTARLRVKQVRPYRDYIKLRLSENDKVILPYVQNVPYADAGDNMHGFDGKEVFFTGNRSVDPNGDPLTYQWDFNSSDGFQVEAEGENASHIFPLPGLYNVTLKVSDGEFTDIDMITAEIEKRVPPKARAGSNITVDRREVFILDGSRSSDPNGDELTYEWDILGEKKTGMMVNHSFDETGSYDIILTVSDGEFQDNDTIGIVVNSNRIPVAVPKLDSDEILGGPVIFNGTSSHDLDGDDIISYFWDFGDGNVSDGPIVEHTYLISGKFDVTLTVFDGSDNGSKILSIDIPTNKDPSGELGKARYIFDNRTYSFYAENVVDPEGMDLEVHWEMGDGTHLEGPIVNHTYQNAGSHTIRMKLIDELDGSFETTETFEVLDSSLYLPETIEILGNYSASHGVQMGYYHETIKTTWIGTWPRVEVIRIPEGGARYYKLNMPKAVYNVSVKVTSGTNIDILLLTQSDKDTYASFNSGGEQRSIDWDEYGTDLNTKQISFQYEGGKTRYLVIGNNGKMAGGAEPTGNVRYDIKVEWSRSLSNPPPTTNDPDEIAKEGRSIAMLFYILCFGLPIFIIGGFFVIFIVVKRRQKREEVAAEKDRANMNYDTGPTTLAPPPLTTSDEGLNVEDWMKEETLPYHLDYEKEETDQVDQVAPQEMTEMNDPIFDENVSDPFSQFEDDGGTNIDDLFSDEEDPPSESLDEFGVENVDEEFAQ